MQRLSLRRISPGDGWKGGAARRPARHGHRRRQVVLEPIVVIGGGGQVRRQQRRRRRGRRRRGRRRLGRRRAAGSAAHRRPARRAADDADGGGVLALRRRRRTLLSVNDRVQKTPSISDQSSKRTEFLCAFAFGSGSTMDGGRAGEATPPPLHSPAPSSSSGISAELLHSFCWISRTDGTLNDPETHTKKGTRRQ